jgi:hypothetical protein
MRLGDVTVHGVVIPEGKVMLQFEPGGRVPPDDMRLRLAGVVVVPSVEESRTFIWAHPDE